MNTLLVWVLVVISWPSSRNMAEMMGPFVDLESCQRVQRSQPLEQFESQGVQILIPNDINLK